MKTPSIIEFECRVPVDGYRVLYFDESKFLDVEEEDEFAYWDADIVPPNPPHLINLPANASEDELHLLNRWGARLLPPDPEAFFEGTGSEWEPEVQAILEPVSEKVRCFDLFEETSSPYEDFVNTSFDNSLVFKNLALRDVESPKKLANRFGPLLEGPQFVDTWIHSIQMLQNAVAVWKKADRTGDFKHLIRGFSQKGRKLFGRNRIDASISLREDPLSGAPQLCIRPETLLDALWTQVAQAVGGSQSLRNCVVCKKWFRISAGEGRSDKEYCSDACRMRAYRKRKGSKSSRNKRKGKR